VSVELSIKSDKRTKVLSDKSKPWGQPDLGPEVADSTRQITMLNKIGHIRVPTE